jgi:hypothetical protein
MMEIPYIPMEITKKDEFRKSLSYHNSCKFCMYYSQGKDKCKRTGVDCGNGCDREADKQDLIHIFIKQSGCPLCSIFDYSN